MHECEVSTECRRYPEVKIVVPASRHFEAIMCLSFIINLPLLSLLYCTVVCTKHIGLSPLGN